MTEIVPVRGLEALKSFFDREQHINVPRNHREDGVWLGMWLANRKVDKRCGKSIEIIEQLDLLFPGWSESKQLNFDGVMSLLKKFVLREGHCLVPRDQREEGYHLGRAVARYRAQYKTNRISSARIQRLESLKGWKWEVRKSYNRRVRLLQAKSTNKEKFYR